MSRRKDARGTDSLLIQLQDLNLEEEQGWIIRSALRELRRRQLIPDKDFAGTLLALAIETFVADLRERGINADDAVKIVVESHKRVAVMAAAVGTLTREAVERHLVSVVAAGDTPLEQMVINLRLTRSLSGTAIAELLMHPERIHVITSPTQRLHPQSKALVRKVERILQKHAALLDRYGPS